MIIQKEYEDSVGMKVDREDPKEYLSMLLDFLGRILVSYSWMWWCSFVVFRVVDSAG